MNIDVIATAIVNWVTTNFEPIFSKNTAFNKNFGTTAGTVLEGDAARYMAIPFSNFTFSPADSTTYYLGRCAIIVPPKLSETDNSFKTGVAGTIVEIHMEVSGNTVSGSNENVAAKIRNVTTATSSSSFGNFTTDATSTTSKAFSLTGTTAVVSATDEVAIEINTPAWGTNPTTVRWGGWILIKLT